MPNYQEAFASIVTWGDTMRTDGSLDIDAAIDDFEAELQAIFELAAHGVGTRPQVETTGPSAIRGGWAHPHHSIEVQSADGDRGARVATGKTGPGQPRFSLARMEAIWGYLFISPWILGFVSPDGDPDDRHLRLHLHEHHAHR